MKEFILNNIGIVGSILFVILAICILYLTKGGYIEADSKLNDICGVFIVGSMFYGVIQIGNDLFTWLFK